MEAILKSIQIPNNQVDRLLGALLGHALGDALGAPHEFHPRKEYIYNGKLEYPMRVNSQWQGIREAPVGSTTDDTAMTVALLRAIPSAWVTSHITLCLDSPNK